MGKYGKLFEPLAKLFRRGGDDVAEKAAKEAAEKAAKEAQEKAAKEAAEKMGKVADPKAFDPKNLNGMKASDIEKNIPSDWPQRPSKSGGGVVYNDPTNRGRQIRIMPGYPPGSRPDPLTWGPYAEVCQNGKTVKIPLDGNPTL